ncbi:exonuclease/endonuclease/phosphatase family protein [Stieleria varia]|nr:hypothetical protein [Stieleria varia]
MMQILLILMLLVIAGCDHSAGTALSDSRQCQPSPVPARPETADTIRILAWNVESGGADAEVIFSQMRQMGTYDVWALSEVSPRALGTYADALVASFQSEESTPGRADRLRFLFNRERFELIGVEELNQEGRFRLNDGNHRSPLVIQLLERETKTTFQITVNHLARRRAELREEQASGLREWARRQTIPSIANGDFNFDYSFETQSGNDAFTAMVRDGVWLWVKPQESIDTNWSDSNNDGIDNYPDSMLGFAFAAGPARDWSPMCRVIQRDGDFPHNEATSDYSPTELTLRP